MRQPTSTLPVRYARVKANCANVAVIPIPKSNRKLDGVMEWNVSNIIKIPVIMVLINVK